MDKVGPADVGTVCVQVQYMPSGLAAKKLGMSPRTLGKITGNLFVLLPEGKEDIGLFVKHGNKGLCVPDYVRAQPEERGWAYSNALVQVLEQYKVWRHASSCTSINTIPTLWPHANTLLLFAINFPRLYLDMVYTQRVLAAPVQRRVFALCLRLQSCEIGFGSRGFSKMLCCRSGTPGCSACWRQIRRVAVSMMWRRRCPAIPQLPRPRRSRTLNIG